MDLQRRTRLAFAWVCILLSISLMLGVILLITQHPEVLPKRGHDVEHSALKTRATIPGVAGASNQKTVHDNLDDSFYVRKLRSSDAWAWNTSLPDHRLLVFYGNPLSPVMGPIGQFSDDQLIGKLHDQARAYSDLDPSHPIVPALDYVTPVVQPVPMDDKSWVYRMPNSSIEHYADLANSNHALFFFDMQIGHSSVQKEVNLVLPYLERPGVELALDPEFDMPPGAIPDEVFGRMKASEVNWVIDTLSNLVLTRHLPPKILIVHRFLQEMLPDWQNIKVKPGVQLITCVDGFGTPGMKIDDYRIYDKEQLIQYPGMKLFYTLDKPLMSPSDVLALDPSPVMVMYQ